MNLLRERSIYLVCFFCISKLLRLIELSPCHCFFLGEVFKIDDPNIVEKLISPEVKQTKEKHYSVLGAGIGVFLATLLKPLRNYLAIPSTIVINVVIVTVTLISPFSTMAVFFFLLLTGFLSITIGNTKVKFKSNKNVAVSEK